MSGQIVLFKTKKSVSSYILTVIFFLVGLYGVYMGANYFVIGTPIFFGIIIAFNDELSIIVYEDRFSVKYSNIFGNFMAIENFYYFKEIKNFKVVTTKKWKASFSQSLIIIIVGIFLPGKNGNLSESSKTSLSFEVQNQLGEINNINIYLGLANKNFLTAIKIISEKCIQDKK